jgi:hypothetical protein
VARTASAPAYLLTTTTTDDIDPAGFVRLQISKATPAHQHPLPPCLIGFCAQRRAQPVARVRGGCESLAVPDNFLRNVERLTSLRVISAIKRNRAIAFSQYGLPLQIQEAGWRPRASWTEHSQLGWRGHATRIDEWFPRKSQRARHVNASRQRQHFDQFARSPGSAGLVMEPQGKSRFRGKLVFASRHDYSHLTTILSSHAEITKSAKSPMQPSILGRNAG